jgi:hypothetical protein
MGQPPDESKTPVRTLRLSAILIDLRQEAAPEAAAPSDAGAASAGLAGETSGGSAARTGKPPRRRIRKQRRPRVRSNITIGEILDRTRLAGFGCIAALLALVAIPFVGLSTPFGLAIAFLGIQMVAGRSHPWLPQRIRQHHVAMSTLEWLSQRLAPISAVLERIVRPRLTLMVAGPFWIACGAGLIIQGAALALPLPIPGSNWLFIVPIILYGIGLLESDGLVIIVCHLITIAEVLAGVWLWDEIVRGLKGVYHSIAGWLG